MKNIVIVDDSKYALKILATVVKMAGFKAVQILVERDTTVEDIVVLVKKKEPILVLLDHFMYGYTGADVALELGGYALCGTSSSNQPYCSGGVYGKDNAQHNTERVIKTMVSQLKSRLKG
jgi:CheY-like chemotaxis protein